MFNSTVLDVAIGLVFTFLAISLAVSAIVEAMASAMKWRSSTLLQGIKDLLNDPNFIGLARSLYNHALVNPQSDGTAEDEKALTHIPAYVDPKLFADAFLDVTKIAQDSPDKVKTAINAIESPQLKRLLNGIFEQTAGNLGQMRDRLASWFDNSMDRVGGIYKRKTQIWSFSIALTIAVALNVSSIGLGKALWLRPMLARTIGPMPPGMASGDAIALVGSLGFPIGWSCAALKDFCGWSALEMLAGWLITAAATLFGAPFWFDLLEQFVRLKGSGPSPAEKISRSGASS